MQVRGSAFMDYRMNSLASFRIGIDLDEVVAIEAAMEAMQRDLRAFRNLKSPVHKLPHELLAIVMEMAIYRTSVHSHVKSSNILASVCQRWRYVAISDAWLWTGIRIPEACSPSSDVVATYFRRSKTIPITINFPGDFYDYSRWLKFLMPLSSRIRGFEITASVSLDFGILLSQLPLPNVEQLTLNRPSVVGDGVSERLSCHLPMPKLKSLNISYFTSWPLEIFSNLSTLGLYQTKYHEVEISMPDLLDVLEVAQSLEDLTIHNTPSEDTSPVTRFVTLSLLSKLDIRFCRPREILSHLHLPSRTNITIFQPDNGNRLDLQTDLLQKLPEDYSRIAALHTVRSLDISFEENSVLLIMQEDTTGAVVRICDDILDDDDSIGLCNVMTSLAQHEVLSSIKSLSINNSYATPLVWENVYLDDWENYFEQWNNLESISLTDCCVEHLFTALGVDGDSSYHGSVHGGSSDDSSDGSSSNSDNGSVDGGLCCPRLHTVRVKLSPSFTSHEDWYETLADMVKSRHSEGHSIRTLQIELPRSKTGVEDEDLPEEIVADIVGLRNHGVEHLLFVYNDKKTGQCVYCSSPVPRSNVRL